MCFSTKLESAGYRITHDESKRHIYKAMPDLLGGLDEVATDVQDVQDRRAMPAQTLTRQERMM